jgi:hypothetical protein
LFGYICGGAFCGLLLPQLFLAADDADFADFTLIFSCFYF